MAKGKEGKSFFGASEGARRATGEAPKKGADKESVSRWSRSRKRAAVIRILGGEPLDTLSRELGVPVYRLEEWRDKALAGMDEGLKQKAGPDDRELLDARRKIGELTMENEILKKNLKRRGLI